MFGTREDLSYTKKDRMPPKLSIMVLIVVCSLLPSRSYAFRPGHSMSICINDLINEVYLSKAVENHVIGICLDVEKAYDCVCSFSFKQRLQNMQIHSRIRS